MGRGADGLPFWARDALWEKVCGSIAELGGRDARINHQRTAGSVEELASQWGNEDADLYELALSEWHLRPAELDDLPDSIVEQLFESWARRRAFAGMIDMAWQVKLWGGAIGGGMGARATDNAGHVVGASGRTWRRVSPVEMMKTIEQVHS